MDNFFESDTDTDFTTQEIPFSIDEASDDARAFSDVKKPLTCVLGALAVVTVIFLFVNTTSKAGGSPAFFNLRGANIERLKVDSQVLLGNRVVGFVESLESGAAKIKITDSSVKIPADSGFEVVSENHWFPGEQVVLISQGRSAETLRNGSTYQLAASGILPTIPWEFIIYGGTLAGFLITAVGYLMKILLKTIIVVLILALVFVVLTCAFPDWFSFVLSAKVFVESGFHAINPF